MADSKHNHDGGKALPFGRKMPAGECPRCDELRNGAAPRSAAWADSAKANALQQDTERAFRRANIARGLCMCGRHPADGRMCTYGEW